MVSKSLSEQFTDLERNNGENMADEHKEFIDEFSQEYEEAKVVRGFAFSAEGQILMDILKRMELNLDNQALSIADKPSVDPYKDVAEIKKWKEQANGVRKVRLLLENSNELMQELEKELNQKEKKESVKNYNLINFSRLR